MTSESGVGLKYRSNNKYIFAEPLATILLLLEDDEDEMKQHLPADLDQFAEGLQGEGYKVNRINHNGKTNVLTVKMDKEKAQSMVETASKPYDETKSRQKRTICFKCGGRGRGGGWGGGGGYLTGGFGIGGGFGLGGGGGGSYYPSGGGGHYPSGGGGDYYPPSGGGEGRYTRRLIHAVLYISVLKPPDILTIEDFPIDSKTIFPHILTCL